MNKTFNDPNLKYSDQLTPLAQMAGFEGGSSDLPTPTAADAGKVLTVDETGAYELGDVDALPAIEAGDAGKVLTVNAGETAAEWAAPSGGLPTPTVADIGTVLGVIYDENGTPVVDTIVPVQDVTITTGYVTFQNSAYAGEDISSADLTWYIVLDNVEHEMTYLNGRLEYNTTVEGSAFDYIIQVDTVTYNTLEFCVQDDRSAVIPGTYNVGLKVEHLPVMLGLMWP